MNSFKSNQDPALFALDTKTTTYAVTNSDTIILADATGGSFTITLPTAVGISGRTFKIKKIDSALNTPVTIATTSSQTFNGSGTTTTLNTGFEEINLISNGSNWLLNRINPSGTVSFTPTGSWVANTTYTGKYRRIGDTAQIEWGLTLAGAPTSAALTLNLPTNMTIDTAKLAVTGFAHHGVSGAKQSTTSYSLTPFYNNTTSIGIAYISSAATAAQSGVTEAAPITWGNGDIIQVTITVPITGWNG